MNGVLLFQLTSEGEVEIRQNCLKSGWRRNVHILSILRSRKKRDIDLLEK